LFTDGEAFTQDDSAGNLALHIIGNLKTYIGLVIGETGLDRLIITEG
jgi:hypothetical protein